MAPNELATLLRASTIEDHDEVLKAANAALRASKSDETAQRTRVVALLKLDRFDDALRAIAEGGDKLDQACALEKAYALYKTGSLEDATTLLKGVGAEDLSFSHVAAQVAYRAERFDEADSIYSRLLESHPGAEESDLHINAKAVYAQSQWQRVTGLSAASKPSESFEICYNEACADIARGDLASAAKLLKRALMLCDASEELTQEDKEAEMRPILAQQAYVYAKMGEQQRALDQYTSLGSTKDSDPDFTVVAENNLAAIGPKAANPYMLQKQASSWAQTGEKAKLFGYQSNAVRRNLLIVDLQANKIDGVIGRTEKTLKSSRHPTTDPSVNAAAVLNATAATQGLKDKALLGKLAGLADKRPKDVGLALTAVQVRLQQGKPGAALAVLEEFVTRLGASEDSQDLDVRFSPGLVALAVSLMRSQGRQASVKAELVKAARHWRDRPASAASSLLQEAGIELARSSNEQDLKLAGSVFEKLFAENQGSHVAAAGMVASLAPSDPKRVEDYVKELPPVSSLIGGVDVAKLLSAGVATVAKSTAVTGKRPAGEAADSRPAKKKRPGKLPKNYEEGKKPDPERWLPLRDRSSYRPKGKKGKKKAAESTQGGMVKEEETLELVGGGGVKVEKAAGGGGKKKKKGKK